MSNKPVLVGQFYSLMSFDRAKALLTCAGLHASSDNEYTIQMRPYLAMALGGAQLFVLPEEVDRARALLEKQQPNVVELNYALRVRKSMLAIKLALIAGVFIGSLIGFRQQNLEAGISVGIMASVIWLIVLSNLFVPKAKLIQKQGFSSLLPIAARRGKGLVTRVRRKKEETRCLGVMLVTGVIVAQVASGIEYKKNVITGAGGSTRSTFLSCSMRPTSLCS